jgi:hypothetical protein
MAEPTLFDAAARSSDPATSHAAATLDRSSLRLQTLEQIRLLVAAGCDGATCHEVTRGLAQRGAVHAENSIARRITSLRKAGLIVDTGRTRPGGYEGVEQTVWTVAG